MKRLCGLLRHRYMPGDPTRTRRCLCRSRALYPVPNEVYGILRRDGSCEWFNEP